MSVKPQLMSKLSSNISTLGVCNKVVIKSKNKSFLTLEKNAKTPPFFRMRLHWREVPAEGGKKGSYPA